MKTRKPVSDLSKLEIADIKTTIANDKKLFEESLELLKSISYDIVRETVLHLGWL